MNMVKSRSKSSRSRRERSENCGYYSEKSPKMSEYCGYYSEKSPQFFKLYVPHHSSQSLRIPPAFIKYFKRVLPYKSILRTPAKRSWRIDMNKVDSDFFFLKGWPEFVRDNSLVFGDFLIFCYTGNLEFYVTIFGKNNCQKAVLITATDDDEPQPLLQRIQTDGPCESEERMCIDSVEMGTSMPVPDNIGALETPSELGTKKPFFEIVLKPTYVHTSPIYVPSKFVESYMSTHRQTARLMHSNKSWLVKLLRRGNLLVFSCGWRKFVADNTLREGDVCSFELICRNDHTFNVVILRGNETPPDKAQGTKTTHASSNREEGNSKVMEGSKRTVEVNIEDASSKFNSEHPFFQIVLTLTSMRTILCIPSKFQKIYINEPRETARLQYGNKRWVVNMRPYKHSSLVFSVGWSKFVKQNSLQVGDFCSFELIEKENYVFKVSISRAKSEEIEGRKSREEGSKRTVLEANAEDASTKFISKHPFEANVEDTSTKFISKHPFFQIVLTPACMRNILGIPSKFQKSYINEPRATATLQYSNKRWVVNLITYKDGRLIFSGGWSKFMKQNSLQIGDVCSFELIEKENYVFTVSISRGKSKEIGRLEDAFGKFTSKHPSFHVVLSPSSVSRHLYIPSKFWTSYIDQPRATARLQCSNQWWMVGLRGYGRGSYFLGGWSKFAKENGLQVGDDCCFELIEKENYVFKVSIARRINNSTPTKA